MADAPRATPPRRAMPLRWPFAAYTIFEERRCLRHGRRCAAATRRRRHYFRRRFRADCRCRHTDTMLFCGAITPAPIFASTPPAYCASHAALFTRPDTYVFCHGAAAPPRLPPAMLLPSFLRLMRCSCSRTMSARHVSAAACLIFRCLLSRCRTRDTSRRRDMHVNICGRCLIICRCCASSDAGDFTPRWYADSFTRFDTPPPCRRCRAVIARSHADSRDASRRRRRTIALPVDVTAYDALCAAAAV